MTAEVLLPNFVSELENGGMRWCLYVHSIEIFHISNILSQGLSCSPAVNPSVLHASPHLKQMLLCPPLLWCSSHRSEVQRSVSPASCTSPNPTSPWDPSPQGLTILAEPDRDIIGICHQGVSQGVKRRE